MSTRSQAHAEVHGMQYPLVCYQYFSTFESARNAWRWSLMRRLADLTFGNMPDYPSLQELADCKACGNGLNM